jgi:hypothetical protein
MTTQHDTPDGTPGIKQTSEYDVSILREARRVLEKYVHLNHVRMYDAMDESDNALALLSTIDSAQANDSTPTASGNKYRVVEIQECAEIRFQIVDNENNPVAARTFKSESAAQKMINNWFGKGFKP